MRLALLLLLLALASAASAGTCVDQAAAIWLQVVVPLDNLTAFLYRFPSTGQTAGVTAALTYYSQLCAANGTLPLAPSVRACNYMNDGICAAALAGDQTAQLRVHDALRRYEASGIGGTHGCADPLTYPVVDETIGFISCPCLPNQECSKTLSSASASSATTGTASVLVGATDDAWALLQAVSWLPVAVSGVALIAALIVLSFAIKTLRDARPSV